MTKKQFKSRIKSLGLDPIQATVLFGFSHPARIYSASEKVSTARERLLETYEIVKKNGRIAFWLDVKKDEIEKMRAKVNSERRKKYNKSKTKNT